MANYLIQFNDDSKKIENRTTAPIGVKHAIIIPQDTPSDEADTFDILEILVNGITEYQAVQEVDRKAAHDAAKAQAAIDRDAAIAARDAKLADLKALSPATLTSLPAMRDALIEVMDYLGLR